MSKDKKTSSRYSFNYSTLQWSRLVDGVRIIGRDDKPEPETKTGKTIALLKAYYKITIQDEKSGKTYSKNELVKMLPWLSQETAKKTRNSVDGMLRSAFMKMKKQSEADKGVAFDNPPKLEWWKPEKKKNKGKSDPVMSLMLDLWGKK